MQRVSDVSSFVSVLTRQFQIDRLLVAQGGSQNSKELYFKLLPHLKWYVVLQSSDANGGNRRSDFALFTP
ncbi:MAG: hypothetical protein PUQ00_18200 [Nostoc sp. S13]|nr:hypothetical protein [Nostoc sp. S13]